MGLGLVLIICIIKMKLLLSQELIYGKNWGFVLSFLSMNLYLHLFIPPLHRRWKWGILNSPPCLSVRPSVCRQLGFRNLLKKLLARFISYLAFTLMGWVSWPPIYFRVPSLIFGRKWGFRNFLTKPLAQCTSFLALTLIGWVSWPLYIFV